MSDKPIVMTNTRMTLPNAGSCTVIHGCLYVEVDCKARLHVTDAQILVDMLEKAIKLAKAKP